jgi:signal transduction histidine kinase
MYKKLIKDWDTKIKQLKLESNIGAMAWYTINNELLASNESMCEFLGTTPEELKPSCFLINPDLSKLKNLTPDSGKLVFEGLLTIGNYKDESYVLKSKIFRSDDIFFIYAEADILNLFENNKKMSRLNQQVNNLQRQLLKEKSKLENTLKELKQTQQMLIHSEKMNALGQMIAGIAHEINNPIAFVTNNIYELKKYTNEIFEAILEIENHFSKTEDKAANEAFNQIKEKYEFDFLTEDISDVLEESQSGVERVKKIVEDLRRFSRLDESEIKNIDIIENIKSTLSIIRSEMEKKQILFEMETPGTMMVNCYPGQLNQAILNIFINAIYAVEEKGNITLKVKNNNDEIQISISDDGCGIPAEIIDKVFNPFFTTKPVGTGTGLGLSITYKIIHELHKGRIETISEINQGTTIHIFIPNNL